MQYDGTIEGRRYRVPLPSGTDGLALYERVASLLDRAGYFDLPHPHAAGRRLRELRALMLIPTLVDGRATVLDTLHGGEVDGKRIDAGSWQTQWSQPPRFLEPYQAAIRVWEAAGFFGASVDAETEAAPEADPQRADAEE